ncbi:MAG TPA: hypothetical protein VIV11_13745 [Kofleriaceae bacterium]
MTELRPCVGCHRHVSVAERACPFCSAELAPGSPRSALLGRASRAAVFAGAALAAAGCGGKKAKSDTTNQNQTATADAGVEEPPLPPDDKNNIPMPYGAPPARRRVV